MTSRTRAFQQAEGQLEVDAIVDALSAKFAVDTGAKRLVRRERLDTFDRRLKAAGLALEQQTVASGIRLVLSHLDGPLNAEEPAPNLRWPARADALPAGPVRDSVATVTGIRALMVISSERRRMRLLELRNEDGKTVVRVELDEPAAIGHDAAPSRLTVRSLRGYDQQARRATRLLTRIGLEAVEQEREPKPAPRPVGTERDAPANELLTNALSAYLATMRKNLPGLLDDVDTEFLHDFRVAVRRTRATLKLGRPCLPEEMRSRWEPAFKWLGDMTTPVRDLDVYELDLPTMGGWLVAAEPTDLESFATHLGSRRAAERRVLVRGLKSAQFQHLINEWSEELDQILKARGKTGKKHLSAGELAEGGIWKAYRRVVRSGTAITPDSPAEDLHRLRKSCKDLRYALEVCTPVVAKVPRKRAVADLKGLQNVLGRFQDAEVQRQALHGFAEKMMAEGAPAAAIMAMGELIGHLDVEQERARLEFDGAFAHFARPSSRRLMHNLGGQS